MSSLFKNILIPVDFTVNTEVAVKQALELACPHGSVIHLIHVIKPKTIWNKLVGDTKSVPRLKDNYSLENITIKLRQWSRSIEETLPNTKVNTYIREGALGSEIHDSAGEIKPELIIIGRDRCRKYLSFFKPVCANSLAKTTGYPVLTAVRKSINRKIKVIVVPVGSFVPVRKIELVSELAKKYRAVIHLVKIPERHDVMGTNQNAFLETYRLLRADLTSPVEHHILKGKNSPKAILEYAERVRADLILVNPGSETKISSVTGTHINDVLTTSSRLNILSIQPYQASKVPLITEGWK